jgi:type II secretory pathway pseudopilin PulG
MRVARLLRARLRSERGFTVIEMMVAAFIGVLVLLVLLNLLDATQNATSRVTTRVDGTQRGRVAMEQVTQRLRSQVCLGTTVPIIAGLTNSVTFYGNLGNTTDFQPEKRRIFVLNGDLHEEVTEGVGTYPNRTFTSTPKDSILAKRVEPAKAGPNDTGYASGSDLPYFRYYAFNAVTPPAADVEVKPPFAAADPARIVKIVVSFKSSTTAEDRVDTSFVDGVTSRIANPNATDTTKRGPQCTT